MFEAFTTWAKEVWNKIMIAAKTIKRIFGTEPSISQPMTDAIALWARIYKNDSPWLIDDVESLNLGAAIASEISRMVTVEATIEIKGGAVEYLSGVMEKVMDETREQVEYGVALGGLIMKPYLMENGTVAIDYVKATDFIPVEFDSSGMITSVIFTEHKKINDFYYTRLEYHSMEAGGVRIRNVAFRSESPSELGAEVPLNSVPEWADLEPDALIMGVDRPLYAYFRFPAANSIDPQSKLGVSCYSRSVDMIQQADELWSNFLWEFESGKRALYVDVLAFKHDADGNPILPNRKLYRTIDAGGQEDALFEDWSPTFRQADLLAGLDAILKRIEFTCGLAYGTLSDPRTVEKTATEIAVSKQRTYALVVDTQKALRDAMEQLAYAVNVWASIVGLMPFGQYEVSFTFDDSMIIDAEARQRTDLQLVNVGLMSKVEFRMRNFNESEEIARQKIMEAQSERRAEMELVMPLGGE